MAGQVSQPGCLVCAVQPEAVAHIHPLPLSPLPSNLPSVPSSYNTPLPPFLPTFPLSPPPIIPPFLPSFQPSLSPLLLSYPLLYTLLPGRPAPKPKKGPTSLEPQKKIAFKMTKIDVCTCTCIVCLTLLASFFHLSFKNMYNTCNNVLFTQAI